MPTIEKQTWRANALTQRSQVHLTICLVSASEAQNVRTTDRLLKVDERYCRPKNGLCCACRAVRIAHHKPIPALGEFTHKGQDWCKSKIIGIVFESYTEDRDFRVRQA